MSSKKCSFLGCPHYAAYLGVDDDGDYSLCACHFDDDLAHECQPPTPPPAPRVRPVGGNVEHDETPIAINMQGPRIQYGTWEAIPGTMTVRRAVDRGWWRLIPRRWRPRESYIPPAAWRRTVVELIPLGGRRVTFRISIETTYTRPTGWKERP